MKEIAVEKERRQKAEDRRYASSNVKLHVCIIYTWW